MYRYYNHYPDLIKFPYFAYLTQREVWGGGGERRAKHKVTLRKTLMQPSAVSTFGALHFICNCELGVEKNMLEM
jgi:hypothetical protein